MSEPLIGICSPELDPHYTMSHYYLYQLSISPSGSYFWLPALYSGKIQHRFFLFLFLLLNLLLILFQTFFILVCFPAAVELSAVELPSPAVVLLKKGYSVLLSAVQLCLKEYFASE